MDHRKLLISFLPVLFLFASASCRKGLETAPVGPPRDTTTCISCSLFDDIPAISFPIYFVTSTPPTEWTVRTSEDWRSFCLTLFGLKDDPATVIPEAPVDLDAKTLLIKTIFLDCGQSLVPRDICFGRERVTVTYEIDQGCCQGFVLLGPYLMFAIDKTDLPIVWEETFVPYNGAPCPTPYIYMIDPPPVTIHCSTGDGGTTGCNRLGGLQP